MNYLYGCFAIIGGLILISLIAFFVMVNRAPDGYEDQEGWHAGKR